MVQIGDQRAPRFQPRQRDAVNCFYLCFAQKQDVAMPAVRRTDPRHRGKAMIPRQRRHIKQTSSCAKPRVGLLQGHDVWRYFTDDRSGAVQIAPPIGADAFVDVPGCDGQAAHRIGPVIATALFHSCLRQLHPATASAVIGVLSAR